VIDPGDAKALVRAFVMLSTDEEKTAQWATAPEPCSTQISPASTLLSGGSVYDAI
jgi:hypothetical protein